MKNQQTKETTELPRLAAYEYEETCGGTSFGNGYIILKEGDTRPENYVAKFSRWTMEEKRYVELFTSAPDLLKWAKQAAEETRARIDPEEGSLVPSWLPELEAIIARLTR